MALGEGEAKDDILGNIFKVLGKQTTPISINDEDQIYNTYVVDTLLHSPMILHKKR